MFNEQIYLNNILYCKLKVSQRKWPPGRKTQKNQNVQLSHPEKILQIIFYGLFCMLVFYYAVFPKKNTPVFSSSETGRRVLRPVWA